MLLWTLVCNLFKSVSMFSLDKYPGVRLLDCIVAPFLLSWFLKAFSYTCYSKTCFISHQHCTRVTFSESPCLLSLIFFENNHLNRELPDVQAGFRKGRGTRDQIANIPWIIEKAREFHNNIYIYCCFIGYAKVFDCVNHNRLWKILKEMEIPDHLTCLLRNLCAG